MPSDSSISRNLLPPLESTTAQRTILLFALVLVAAIGFSTYNSLRRYSVSTDRVEHTFRVITEGERLHVALKSAELNTTLYQQTKQRAFALEAVAQASLVRKTLAELQSLTWDNPEQQQRLRNLSHDLDRKLLLIQLQDSHGLSSPSETAETLALNAQLSEQLEQFLKVERLLLEKRSAQSDHREWFSGLLIAAGSGFLFLVLAVSTWMLDRGRQRAEEQQKHIRSLNSDLVQKIAEVQEARVLLDLLFEKAPVGVGLWDRQFRYLRANGALAQVDRMPVNQMIGKTVQEVLPGMSRLIVPLLEQILETGEPIRNKDLSSAVQGRAQTRNVSFYPIGERPHITGIGIICQDVTDERGREQQLRETAKLESLGVLAGGIAHDFNNLLTGILGNTSLVADLLKEDDPTQPMLAEVLSAGERAAELTRQMLAFSGKGRFYLEDVDIGKQVRETSAFLRGAIPRHVELNLEVEPDLAPVTADCGQIQQLLTNLVVNAAEAIGAHYGKVTVRVSMQDVDETYAEQFISGDVRPGRYVQIQVSDNGAGIDAETLKRMYEPFFTTKFVGRGLGLSAVSGIVQGHEGAIQVYSVPGQGTTFTILFPPATGIPVSSPEPTATGDPVPGVHVLVVDDEETVQRTVRAALEQKGLVVEMAANGKEGLDCFQREPDRFHVILLDVNMPVMNGAEALKKIRAIRPKVPVIMSSGFQEMAVEGSFASFPGVSFYRSLTPRQRSAKRSRGHGSGALLE